MVLGFLFYMEHIMTEDKSEMLSSLHYNYNILCLSVIINSICKCDPHLYKQIRHH